MLRKASVLFRTFIASIGITLMLIGISQGQVQASHSLTVNTLADSNDGICDASDCTLRDAIASAESGAKIKFATGLTGTITFAMGEAEIVRDLTIKGPGVDVITLSGGHNNRVFSIAGDATVEISDLTIADGFDPSGAGVLRLIPGTSLTLKDVIVENSMTLSGAGGAILNEGTLIISRSILRNNSAGTIGGAIYSFGNLTIDRSILQGNRAVNGGGAIVFEGITMNINRSSIIENLVTNTNPAIFFGGGALMNRSAGVTITRTTIQGNSAFNGAGIHNDNTTPPLLRHSIISNPHGNTNCFSTDSNIIPVRDGGHNLQYPGTSCGPTIPVGDPS
jgi:CSLREA domain-containing protein